MSPSPIAPPLTPAPFVGDIPRIQQSPPPYRPTNNIAPFRPTPYNAPAPAPFVVPAAPAIGVGAASAGAGAGLLAIAAVVVGGIVGGLTDPLSPSTLPPGRKPKPFPFPPAPPIPGREPDRAGKRQPRILAGTWVVPYSSPSAYYQYIPPSTVRGLSNDPVTMSSRRILISSYLNIYQTNTTVYIGGTSFDGNDRNGAPLPPQFVPDKPARLSGLPEAPPAPAPRPDAPRPDRPTLPPGVQPQTVPKPFTRPAPKTTPPSPSPGTPNPGPKPFNVPKPFTRPNRPGQPSPDRRLPPPNQPGPGPKPKTDPATPGAPSPSKPNTEPGPKTPQTPAPDRPRIPGPVPIPTPQTIPPFSPQFDPPTIPQPPVTPFPVPSPNPSPNPRIDPTPAPSPNPNPRPFPVPVPLPLPNPAPQPNPTPAPDPSPTPNPNPRRFPPPPSLPQADPAPKPNPFPAPNPNPPRVPPPIVPPAIPPITPPPINPPPIVPPTVCPPCPPCPDPCKDVPNVLITYKKFVGCNKVLGVPVYFINQSVLVSAPYAAASKILLDNQADLLALQCEQNDCVAAIPDWWQVRLGADRPQLIVLYARKFSDGTWDKPKYAVSIPRWSKSEAQTVYEDFPIYQKGQYQGTTIFSDNSKLIVNCINAIEAERVTNKLLLSILDTDKQDSVYSTTFRRGRALSEITVYPRMVKYFATGQRNLQPTWSKKF